MKRWFGMILLHSWRSLQTTFPTRAMEWFLGFLMMAVGSVFIVNPTLFDVYAAQLAGLSSVADQDTWAAVCLIVGLARIAALMINGLWWRSPLVRCAMAFGSCFIWWQLSAGVLPNVGMTSAVFPLCVIFDAYNAIRCGRKTGVSEYVHRLELQAEARHGHSRQSADA